MKKTLIVLAVAGTFASAPAFADNNASKFDGTGSVYGALSTVDSGLDDNAVGVKIGYNRTLDAVFPGLSADVEASTSVVDSEGAYDSELSYVSVGSYARYTYGLDKIVQGLDGYARAGVAYSAVDVSVLSVNSEIDGFDLTYGAGFSYDVAPGVSVFAEYTAIGGDVDLDEFSGGVKFAY